MYRFGDCSGDLNDVYIDECEDQSFYSFGGLSMAETMGGPMEGHKSSLTGPGNQDPAEKGAVNMRGNVARETTKTSSVTETTDENLLVIETLTVDPFTTRTEDPTGTRTLEADPDQGHGEILDVNASWSEEVSRKQQNFPGAWSPVMGSTKDRDRHRMWGPLGTGSVENANVHWSVSDALVGLKRSDKQSDSGCYAAVGGSSCGPGDCSVFSPSKASSQNNPVVRQQVSELTHNTTAWGVDASCDEKESGGSLGDDFHPLTDLVENTVNVPQKSVDFTPNMHRCPQPQRQIESCMTSLSQMSLNSPTQQKRSEDSLAGVQRFPESSKQQQKFLSSSAYQQRSMESPSESREFFEPQVQTQATTAKQDRSTASPIQHERSPRTMSYKQASLQSPQHLQKYVTSHHINPSSEASRSLVKTSDTVPEKTHAQLPRTGKEGSDLGSSLSSLDSGSNWLRQQEQLLSEAGKQVDPTPRTRQWPKGAGDARGHVTRKSSSSSMTSRLHGDLLEEDWGNMSTVTPPIGLPELMLSWQGSHPSSQYGRQPSGQTCARVLYGRPEALTAACDVSPQSSGSKPFAGSSARMSVNRDLPDSWPDLSSETPDIGQRVEANQRSSKVNLTSSDTRCKTSGVHLNSPNVSLEVPQVGFQPPDASPSPSEWTPRAPGFGAYNKPQPSSDKGVHSSMMSPSSSKPSRGQFMADTGPDRASTNTLHPEHSTHHEASIASPLSTSRASQVFSNVPKHPFNSACKSSVTSDAREFPESGALEPSVGWARELPSNSNPELPMSGAPYLSTSSTLEYSMRNSPELSTHVPLHFPGSHSAVRGVRTLSQAEGRAEGSDDSDAAMQSLQRTAQDSGGEGRPNYRLQKSVSSGLSSNAHTSLPSHSQLDPILSAVTPIQEQTWVEMDKDKDQFVRTVSMEEAQDILTENGIVLLTGPPFSGKTTLAHALLRNAESENRPACIITSASEWREQVKARQRPIVLLDEVFGRTALKVREVDAWRRPLNVMGQWCREGSVQLVFTFSPPVLASLREMLPKCELFFYSHKVSVGSWCKQEKLRMLYRTLKRRVTPAAVNILLAEARKCESWGKDVDGAGQFAQEKTRREADRQASQDRNQDHDREWSQDHDREWNQDHDREWNQDHDREWNQDHDREWNQDHDREWNQDHDREWNQLLEMLACGILKIDESCAMFPRCCQWLADFLNSCLVKDVGNLCQFLESGIKIFSRPSPLYQELVKLLLQGEDVDREKAQAVLCLFLGRKDIKDKDTVVNTCRSLGFSSTFSSVGLQEIPRMWIDVLLKEEKDCYTFINRHAYEGAALALGECLPHIVVKIADWPFLVKRCKVPIKDVVEIDDLRPFQLEIKRVDPNRRGQSVAYRALVERVAQGLKNPQDMVLAVQHPVLSARDFVYDLKEFYDSQERVNTARFVFSQKYDSIHGMSLLYWSVFNADLFLFEWIFKTFLTDPDGGFRKEELVLTAYACCVLENKFEFLKLLLKYWKKVAPLDVSWFLRGQHLSSKTRHLPLPKAKSCLTDWKDQLKHVNNRILELSQRADTNETSSSLNQRDTNKEGNVSDLSAPEKKAATKGLDISSPPLQVATEFGNEKVVEHLVNQVGDTATLMG